VSAFWIACRCDLEMGGLAGTWQAGFRGGPGEAAGDQAVEP